MKRFKPILTCTLNAKGVLDVDTVKGCAFGMKKYPKNGCYGMCYASSIARARGYNFSESISRNPVKNIYQNTFFEDLFIGYDNRIYDVVKNHSSDFFRIGVMGDPSHDWELTANVCKWLDKVKIPIIVTKHWKTIPYNILNKFNKSIINTSISALDSTQEIEHRLNQYLRIKSYGIKSILRIVTCKFGDTVTGIKLNYIQNELLKNESIIDNPLRINKNDIRVLSGDIIVDKIKDLNSKVYISLNNKNAYLGHCENCPDQCGINL